MKDAIKKDKKIWISKDKIENFLMTEQAYLVENSELDN